MARDLAAAAGTAPTTGVPKVPCPSPRRAYAWLVGWHGRHTTQCKLSDHQRFVQTLHRLKFLKRQMYGRAGLDLLRVRVLHPN
jgi:hypothetical protein